MSPPSPITSSLPLSNRPSPRPSPSLTLTHQAAAIPLGRAGADLLVRARSGTGKTAAFGVIAAGLVDGARPMTQVLVLSPTREVALQTAALLAALAARGPPPPGPAVAALIGGLPLAADAARLRRPAQLVAATPGRAAALAARGDLVLSSVRLLVLDEVDALLAPGGALARDVEAVIARLPRPPPPPAAGGGGEGVVAGQHHGGPPPLPPPRCFRQTLAFSATLDPGSAAAAAAFMGPNPVVVDPSGPDAGPALDGVAHFYTTTAAGGDSPAGRAAAAVAVLATVPFCQAALFAGSRDGAAALASAVREAGHAVALLSGGLSQPARMDALAGLRSFAARVAVTTDVGARGVDLERVTLVINADAAPCAATLAHRAGRAGRFGGAGVCVSVVGDGGGTAGGVAALQAALAAIGAAPAVPLPPAGLSADAAHGGYAPPSDAEAGAWAAHEEGVVAGSAAAAAAAAAARPPSPPPPPPPAGSPPPWRPRTAYPAGDLMSLRPSAGPRPPGLPPAVARKEEEEEEEKVGAPLHPKPPSLQPPATPTPARAARPSPRAPPPPLTHDDAVYDDEAALAAAIIATHWAAEADEEGEGTWAGDVGEGWEEGEGEGGPACRPPPPPPVAAPFALPDAALVPVPAWLLRRYYELEWDAWSRRVEAWRAVQGGG